MSQWSAGRRACAALAVACLLASCDAANTEQSTDLVRQPRGSSSTNSNSPPQEIPELISPTYKVFAANRRGMSFPDRDFSVFAIFPPANFFRAQVVQLGEFPGELPRLIDNSQIELRYSAVADATGSINRTSVTKTNFWTHAKDLYQFLLPASGRINPDEGVHGMVARSQSMPGSSNAPQAFTLFDETKTFTAPWVPITPVDDAGKTNHFPRMKVDAVDKVTGTIVASTTIVVPIAEPMNCASCHATGLVGASRSGVIWSATADRANQGKENVMRLHDALHGVYKGFEAPLMCVECHYSPVADPDGRGPYGFYQERRQRFSISIHAAHGLGRDGATPSTTVPPNIPENGNSTCTVCHGGNLPYFRDSMASAGLLCQDCHGGMIAVAKSPMVGSTTTRTPFIDEPRCESCHTGDEVSHLGSTLVLRKAFEEIDVFATPRTATNRRFAEEPTRIYRTSVGHGGVGCISCHGSPHAIWPVQTGMPDDTIPSQLQGHGGAIIECVACHSGGIAPNLDGPHGLHNIADAGWITDHARFYLANTTSACQTCHGLNLTGGYLSRAASVRTFSLPNGRTVTYAKGAKVGCADCHGMPR